MTDSRYFGISDWGVVICVRQGDATSKKVEIGDKIASDVNIHASFYEIVFEIANALQLLCPV